jgi:hypothetical protein
MLVGAGIFAEVYTFIKDTILKWGDIGKITIPKALGINHWIVIVLIWGMMVAFLLTLEKKRL